MATIHELTVGVVTQVKENGEEVKTILEKENLPESEENTESASDMELEIDEKDEILENSEQKAETSESCSEDLKMSVENEKSTEKAESVEKMHVDEKPVELTEEDSDVKSTHQPVESPKINEKNFLPSEKVSETASETSIKTDTINDEQKIEKIIDDQKITSPSKSSVETTKDVSRPGTSSSIENSDYFVDSDDDLSHSSLDSELEDAELLRLIDNLDSD